MIDTWNFLTCVVHIITKIKYLLACRLANNLGKSTPLGLKSGSLLHLCQMVTLESSVNVWVSVSYGHISTFNYYTAYSTVLTQRVCFIYLQMVSVNKIQMDCIDLVQVVNTYASVF